MSEGRFSSQSRVSVVQSYCTVESVETPTLFCDEAREQPWRSFQVYDPMRKIGVYIEGTITWSARLDG